MNKQQVLQEIRQMIKPYLNVDMPQSTFSYTLTQIEKGIAKPKTEADFIAKMGFVITKEAEYEPTFSSK